MSASEGYDRFMLPAESFFARLSIPASLDGRRGGRGAIGPSARTMEADGMAKEFEVRWEGDLPGSPEEVWDAITVHTAGWLWQVDYEPRLGGSERGVASVGGTVTAWDPARHFTTRIEYDDGAFNQLDYVIEARGTGSYLRYVHGGMFADDEYDQQLDMCQRHTEFYLHTLGEYVGCFSGRDAVHFTVDAPAASAEGGFAVLRRALGIAGDVVAGDKVHLTPRGLTPIEGVVDYATGPFLGVRGADTLYRFFGRDEWGRPTGVALHLYSEGAGKETERRAWNAWLTGVFATEGAA
jgi:uncharacterized protein YndB with AHSA1/START domain